MNYDHKNATRHTLADCEAAVGQRFTLTLSGTIDGVEVSPSGPFVRAMVDERWGFGEDFVLGIDLDALELGGASAGATNPNGETP